MSGKYSLTPVTNYLISENISLITEKVLLISAEVPELSVEVPELSVEVSLKVLEEVDMSDNEL